MAVQYEIDAHEVNQNEEEKLSRNFSLFPSISSSHKRIYKVPVACACAGLDSIASNIGRDWQAPRDRFHPTGFDPYAIVGSTYVLMNGSDERNLI